MQREGYNLIPCPFCGMDIADFTRCNDLGVCEEQDCDYKPYNAVICSFRYGGCGSCSGFYQEKRKAAAAWNRRAFMEFKVTGGAKEPGQTRQEWLGDV